MKSSPRKRRGWLVIRCEPGREAVVRNEMLDQLALHGLESRIEDLVIPKERITHIRRGRRSSEERTYGILLVKAILDESTARRISETPGVTKLIRSMEESERVLRAEVEDEHPKVRIRWFPSDRSGS